MKTIKLCLLLICMSLTSFAQVGVGNTDPKAILDISASNSTSPSNSDGILIPRIDNFPITNPTSDQDGMMVFATGNGAPLQGFYYWDNDTTSWISVRGSDSDFFEIGTTTPPDAIIDDIYTLGKLKIGQNSPANSSLSVHDWNSNNFSAVSISRSLNTASTSGQFNGFYTSLDAQTSDNYFGVQSMLSGNIQAESANYYALASGSLNGFTNLFSGSYYSASGTGILYGVNVDFMSTVTNTGNKYGFNVDIPTSLSGTHYGLYSNVQNSSGYAAYLIGRTSLGQSTANRYIMPSADGSAGQVMTTDGLGNISFETPVSGAERINDLLDAKSDNDGSDDGSSLFIGVNAGASDDSTSNQNVAIGFNALELNVDGVANSAFGWRSLALNTASNNTAFGYLSASGNTTGSMNTAIGRNALISNEIGNNNTALGFYAGWLARGSGNVFLGANSGFNEVNISNKLFIENTDADQNSALIYGEFGSDNTTIGNILRTNSEFQIGNPTITGYAFPSTDGTNGQVLTTDGSGNVSFQNIVGDGTGTDNQNLTTATLTGTTLNLGIQNGTGTSVNLASLTDDSDWVPVGANIERQSGDVYIGNTNATNNNIYISNNIIDWDDTNYYLNPDDMSVMDEIQFDSGTAADPSIFFQDINTGFFSPSNAVTAYSVNGNESFRIQNDGEISIGLIGATNYKFSLNSLINQNTIRIGNDVFSSDNFVDIYHSAQRGNAMNISVNDPYSLASRSGISVFNELGDTNVDIAKYATGSSNIYGLEIYIPEDIVGTEYGVYSNVLTTNGYAAYFLGEVSLGTTSGNTYSLPNSRGTNGQVMQTDGLGNVTWQNPTTNTDNQQIDSFSFNSSTNELTLEIEEDGQPAQTVDLSNLNPQKAIARLFMSASQTEIGSGITKVNFDAAQFDIGSNFNMTTDAYEIPETAIYRVTAQITMDASTGTGTFDVRIRVNGTQERRAEYNHTGNGQIVRQITSILSLAAGDTLDIAFNRPAIGATIQANSRATFFEIEQL
ncbi:beta strand repeat-containing protein [Winogradskyella schleiferi]|uniref:beta strand repeat-containing protein n=1 Tax=Winogradskyella schleiferi TaxID=2686078 RepID=UPI0015BC0B83|nr:hypothetical protein [Winogradskyella schleiferi]